jgi:hypothetical protein
MHFVRIAAAALVLFPLAQGPKGDAPVVTTEKEAVILMPAELVAAPTVMAVQASDNGRYVLVARQFSKMTSDSLKRAMAGGPEPVVETRLVLWDNVERTAREVWKSSGSDVEFQEVRWFPKGQGALVRASGLAPVDPADPKRGMTQRHLLLRLYRGQVSQTDLGQNGWCNIHMSPLRPLAVIETDIEGETTVSLLEDSGRSTTPALPDDIQVRRVEWLVDGSPVVYGVAGRPRVASPPERGFVVDIRNGQTREVGEKEKLALYEPKNASLNALRLITTVVALGDGDAGRTVKALWMVGAEKTEYPRALVAVDAPDGQLLPRGDTVLYASSGAVWVRPLVRLPRDLFINERREAEKAVCLSNGKQVAIALIMYSADYDDALPPADGSMDVILPYLKTSQLLEHFHYTFRGTKAEPTDEFGYVEGPGGRAVVFGDGHVEWRDDR